MLSCFIISGLFFMNSGLIDKNGELNEEYSIKVLSELDKSPIIKIDAYEIIFHTRGTLTEITEDSIVISSKDKTKTFPYVGNLSKDDYNTELRIDYIYLLEGGKKVVKIKKYPNN